MDYGEGFERVTMTFKRIRSSVNVCSITICSIIIVALILSSLAISKARKLHNGRDCWDINQDRKCNRPTEDVNGDGVCDESDCNPRTYYGNVSVDTITVNYLSLLNTSYDAIEVLSPLSVSSITAKNSSLTLGSDVSGGSVIIQNGATLKANDFYELTTGNGINFQSTLVLDQGLKFGINGDTVNSAYFATTSRSFTGPWGTTNLTVGITYDVFGHSVTLNIPGFNHTCTTGTYINITSVLPTSVRPLVDTIAFIPCTEAEHQCKMFIGVDGSVRITRLDETALTCTTPSTTVIGISGANPSYVGNISG